MPPTHKPYLPLLPSHKASPPFDWYSLRLLTEGWPGWVDLGGWLYSEIGFLHRELNRGPVEVEILTAQLCVWCVDFDRLSTWTKVFYPGPCRYLLQYLLLVPRHIYPPCTVFTSLRLYTSLSVRRLVYLCSSSCASLIVFIRLLLVIASCWPVTVSIRYSLVCV